MMLSSRPTDSSLKGRDDDQLGRRRFVEGFTRLVTTFATSDGSNVFALYGEWGSGKTSCYKMLLEEVHENHNEVLVVPFNPWDYSTQKLILDGFFSELLAHIGDKPLMAQVSSKFRALGKSLVGLGAAANILSGIDPSGTTTITAGAAVAGSASIEAIAKAAENSAPSLRELRCDVETALVKAGRPILIVVDDLDRLPAQQLVEVLQLVRINASLPYVNYLLLLDRENAEKSLDRLGFPATYLEKIIQFGVSLPHPAPEDLHRMSRKRLKAALGEKLFKILEPRIDSTIKETAPFLHTPRAIVRVTESFQFHLGFFRSDGAVEVDPLDLFLLEVLRCQVPVAYVFVRDETGAYVQEDPLVAELHARDEEVLTKRRKKFDAMVAQTHGLPANAIEEVIRVLVPGYFGGRINGEKAFATARISSHAHFRTYFELTAPRAHPSQADLHEVLDFLGNQPRTNEKILSLFDHFEWGAVMSSISTHFVQESDCDRIRSLTTGIWLADLRRLGAGVGTPLSPTADVADFTLALMRNVPDENLRSQLLEKIFESTNHLGAFYRTVSVEQFSLSREKNYRSALLPAELKRLRRTCVLLVDDILKSESATDEPMLTWYLAWKSHVAGPESVFAWTNSLLPDRERFASFLRHIVVMEEINNSGNQVPKITRGMLQKFFTIDERFLAKFPSIDGPKTEGGEFLVQTKQIAEHILAGIEDPWEGRLGTEALPKALHDLV